jgi:Tol biopolymer transport system component
VKQAVFVLVLAVLVCASPVSASEPAGPRLAISVFGFGPGEEGGSQAIVTTGPSGEDRRRLFGYSGASIGDGLSWSSDGNRLALALSGIESAEEEPFGTGWPVAAVLRLDGGDSGAFPRAFLNGGDPVMSPDGSFVVFQRVKLFKVLPGRESLLFKSSVWALDVEDGSVKPLTPWRLSKFLEPSSFSPDGSTLAVDSFGYRVGDGAVAIDLSSGRMSLPARKASEPVYSPDGTRLAFVRNKVRHFNLPKPDRPTSELWVAHADGSAATRVLRKKGYITFPSWDASGSRLSFTHNPPAESTGGLEPEPGNEVMAINADGTCPMKVFSNPSVIVYGSAWRPGPGREAGPISC